MASHDEILKALLAVAGNPETGAVKDFAPLMAAAIVALDHPAGKTVRASDDLPVDAEVRVMAPKERR